MIDCLKTELVCPLEQYQQWLALLPEGEARRKLQGLLTFGEITIDSTPYFAAGKCACAVARQCG
ncbi:formate hydrogenlyase maturation protein HycH [Atlantibacter hermannii]|nr:formate hydrogenlyase maturation protein HycH [Atlantibacter hermannii]